VFGVFNIREGAGLSGNRSLKIETAPWEEKSVILETVLLPLPLVRIFPTYYFIKNKFYTGRLDYR